MVPFSAVRAICRKRDGGEHPPGEIESMISGVLDGSVADYQLTAWMMAVLWRGMTRDETARLTHAMMVSGKCLPIWESGPPVVDKHSTGGVGDKVSLIVAPIAAACGLRVPMVSGRALGHTGGTLDKLESIPGYRAMLEPGEFRGIVERIGCSIAGASPDLVPADRKMYALRDVSGIVESPPLIVSSILSKKAAARVDGLVLDVKVGAGGFTATRRRATGLARALLDTGADLGICTEALLTWMGDPLGRAVGNALEVAEAIRFLRGDPVAPDLESVCLENATGMLRVAGERDEEEIRHRVCRAWRSGAALDRFGAMIEAHGGDHRILEDPTRLPKAEAIHRVTSGEDGWVASIDARAIGEIVIDMGGGRRRVTDRIDPTAGIVILSKPGDRVTRGAELAELHLSPGSDSDRLGGRLRRAFRILPHRPKRRPAILQHLRPAT